MKNVKYLMVVSCLSAVALAGCQNFVKRDPFGVHPLIENDEFEKIDLIAVLTGGTVQLIESDDLQEKRRKLEEAFAGFNEGITVEADQKRARNRVQERILAASNQACGDYKQELKQLDSEVNFVLGSLTTGLAGAGAIFTGVDIVRALSGAAGIASGVRAKFNEDFFQSLTIQVITDGLESKRQEIYEKILEDREQGVVKYPVQRAIKDAIKYHENCSLISGLEQAAISIERAENPGADAMNKFLKSMGDTRSALDVMTGKPQIGVAAATQDLPLLYVSLDGSNQTRSTVRGDADKRLKIPADREKDPVARTALENWKAVVDAAFLAFDKAYTEILKTTVEIAAKVQELTAEIKDNKTTTDQRSVKTAELAVEQAKIRFQVNEMNRAEQTLARSVESALKRFESAMDKVKAKIVAEKNAETAAKTERTKESEAQIAKTARDQALTTKSAAEERLKEAQASGNADAIAKAQADFKTKSKAADDADAKAVEAETAAQMVKKAQAVAKKLAEKAKDDAEAAAKAPSGDSGSSSAALSVAPVLPVESQPVNN